MAEMKEKLQELSTDSEPPATSSGNKVNQKVPCQHNTIDTDKLKKIVNRIKFAIRQCSKQPRKTNGPKTSLRYSRMQKKKNPNKTVQEPESLDNAASARNTVNVARYRQLQSSPREAPKKQRARRQ